MWKKITLLSLISLVFYGVSYGATVLFPYQGGTGTGTVPTVNQILIGQSNGTYAPKSTSSIPLGFPVGSDTQIQFNNGGFLGASSNLTFTTSTNILYINGQTSSTNLIAVQSTSTNIGITNQLTLGNVSNPLIQQYDNAAWGTNTKRLTLQAGVSSINQGMTFDTKYNFDYQSNISAEPNLISYWKMDNDWLDSKGTNHGTATGATFGTAKYGSASGSFDGSGDEINIGTNLAAFKITVFSIEAWVKMSPSYTDYGRFYQTYHGAPETGAILRAYYETGTNLYAQLRLSNGVSNLNTLHDNGGVIINDGNWHHIVAVNESATSHKLYVDGVLRKTDTTNFTVSYTSSCKTIIGSGDGVASLNGSLDEVSFYNSALSATTIASHYGIGLIARNTWTNSGTNLLEHYFGGNIYGGSGNTKIQLTPSVADSATAKLAQIYSENSIVTAGALLLDLGVVTTQKWAVDKDGKTLTPAIRPLSDSTTAIQLQKNDGTNILNVDTTNSRVGIGMNNPGFSFDVTGNIRAIGNIYTGNTSSDYRSFMGKSGSWLGNSDDNFIFASYKPAIYFATNNSATVSLGISSTGVAIGKGTTAAASTLDVGGITSLRERLLLYNTAGDLLGFLGKSGTWFGSADNNFMFSSYRPNFYLATNGSGTPSININSTGMAINKGVNDPTAQLHIAAGTATANTGQLKLDASTLVTTPEAGLIERTTDDLQFTIGTGSARKKIVLDDGTALTSGRVPFATTNGRLTDDADFTFATDTLTVTKIAAHSITGDVDFVGSGAGWPYGHMYTNTNIVVPVAVSDTWYEADVNTPDFTTGELNNVTFTDHYLTVSKAGRYSINFNMSAKTTTAGDELAGTVAVNGTASETAHGHTTMATGNAAVSIGGNTILNLAANDQVSLSVKNHSAARDITITHAQISIKQIGG